MVVLKEMRGIFSHRYTQVIKVHNQYRAEPEMLCIGLEWWRISGRLLLTVMCVRRIHQLNLKSHSIPNKPQEKWACVYLKGKDYLVIVDFTDFFEICKLQQTTTASVVEATKEHFERHGVPVTVHSDDGSEFPSQEFQAFAKEWEFEHIMSSSPTTANQMGHACINVAMHGHMSL